MSIRRWYADLAWLEGRAAEGVLVETEGSHISVVTEDVAQPPPDAVRLRGLTLPGLANVHSHAFHRALRGRTQRDRGTFWTWREHMYALASRLDPDSYYELARATYAEMALAGITCVGEFHYLHHAPGGVAYADPNAMGAALVAAAGDAGIRITLLDTCYLTSGFDHPLEGPQRRFGDGDAAGWAERVSTRRLDESTPHARLGAAIHSVRAVPAEALPTVAGWARERGAPLHVHLSEQQAENDGCREAYGRTPAAVLAEHGVLGPDTCAVHATHLTGDDIGLLGSSDTGACLCPTTERDLADGIGPAGRLAAAGSPLSVGSDSHAVIDPFEEARAVELHERLVTRRRGHFTAAALLEAASGTGHAALGWPEAGSLAAGAAADLVTLGLDSPRLAGTEPGTAAEQAVFAATAADVRHVVASGREIVRDGAHQLVEDVPGALAGVIDAVYREG